MVYKLLLKFHKDPITVIHVIVRKPTVSFDDADDRADADAVDDDIIALYEHENNFYGRIKCLFLTSIILISYFPCHLLIRIY